MSTWTYDDMACVILAQINADSDLVLEHFAVSSSQMSFTGDPASERADQRHGCNHVNRACSTESNKTGRPSLEAPW